MRGRSEYMYRYSWLELDMAECDRVDTVQPILCVYTCEQAYAFHGLSANEWSKSTRNSMVTLSSVQINNDLLALICATYADWQR
jgi:hypothetical protein